MSPMDTVQAPSRVVHITRAGNAQFTVDRPYSTDVLVLIVALTDPESLTVKCVGGIQEQVVTDFPWGSMYDADRLTGLITVAVIGREGSSGGVSHLTDGRSLTIEALKPLTKAGRRIL